MQNKNALTHKQIHCWSATVSRRNSYPRLYFATLPAMAVSMYNLYFLTSWNYNNHITSDLSSDNKYLFYIPISECIIYNNIIYWSYLIIYFLYILFSFFWFFSFSLFFIFSGRNRIFGGSFRISGVRNLISACRNSINKCINKVIVNRKTAITGGSPW